MEKYLFLDFDGVLFDTLKEAYILCRYAFSGIDYYIPVDENEYKKFYRYKFLVFNSWQYYYLMSIIKENLTDEEFINKYTFLLNNRDLKSEEDFDKKYYSVREDLMLNHHKFWDKLETPFPFFEHIKQLTTESKYIPIIVSKKNKNAIEYRLNQYGLHICTRNIYGKDELSDYKTKADFINEFMATNNIKTAYFIDDNSNNLEPCKKYPEIIPLLAGWGNIKIGETGLSAETLVNRLL